MSSILFSGIDIQLIDQRIDGDSDILVVSFPRRAGKPSFARPGFGEGWFEKIGVSAIIVRAASNHWFQTPETEEAMAIIAETARSFRRVVAYGSSMGAYAALICSEAIGANAVLAISPLATMDRRRVPWERRWQVDCKHIETTHGYMRDDISLFTSKTADIFVVADCWLEDTKHASIIADAVPRMQLLRTPSFGHSATTGLRDIGIISSFVQSMISGKSDLRYWRTEIRRRRRDFPTYWVRLAKRAAKSRRFELAHAAVVRALRQTLSDDLTVEAAKVLLTSRDPDGALRVLDRVRSPGIDCDVTRVKILLKLGRTEEALSLFSALTPQGHPKIEALAHTIARQKT